MRQWRAVLVTADERPPGMVRRILDVAAEDEGKAWALILARVGPPAYGAAVTITEIEAS